MRRLLSLPCILILVALSACVSTPGGGAGDDSIRITLVGDSTQTERQGYGTGFCANLLKVDCVNRAKGGASTKTYRRDGLWSAAQSPRPNWMLIQFGHNDVQSGAHNDRQTDLAREYPANLRRYVEEARAAGIRPVLLTPIARRYFLPDGKIVDDLAGHVAAVKKLAVEMNVPLIDLHAISQRHFESLGENEAHKLGPTKIGPNGTSVPDKTHFNQLGSYRLGRLLAEAMVQTLPELARHLKPEAAQP